MDAAVSLSAPDVAAAFAERHLDLAAFGAAYLVLLVSAVLTLALFIGARSYLVVSPNRSARDYGVYVTTVLLTLLVATVLENELASATGTVALAYVALPQLLMLVGVHLAIYQRQEPWLIALGGAAVVATVVTVAAAGMLNGWMRGAHWLTCALLAALVAWLWVKSVSTKRGFVKARSIYLASKETLDADVAPQKPWLGLPHWVALLAASIVLALANALLRGTALEQVPAAGVVRESTLILAVTAAVAALPALTYWLARRSWMPQLTRFVWLVWIVVGFGFTYGNYLTSLDRV